MKIWKKAYEVRIARLFMPLTIWAKRVTFPGFDKIPLYYALNFFYKGLRDGVLGIRAASVSFNLFIAIFPAIIFFFTLIPIIPIDGFQDELLLMLQSLFPDSVYSAVQKTIEDIIKIPHGGLLSLGVVMALYFSTSGVVALISAFNSSVNINDTRSWWEIRLISILLVIILSVLVITAITLITFTQTVLNHLVKEQIMEQGITFYIITIGKWIVILALLYFAYAFLFYLAPARKSKWKFISAGGTLSTILSIIITLGFSFYIDHFGKYNALYGSIGTIPVLMLMIYLNCISLIIGFELNQGIIAAKNEKAEIDI